MTPIPHSKPVLPTGEEWREVTCRLAEGWIADGPCVDRFARQAAALLGGTGGVAVNSGTSALHLALLAVGVRPGDDVLLPAYSCAALLNAVRLAEATPLLVDSEPEGFNLCPEDARRRATKRTGSVVVVHSFGQPAPLAPFLDLGIPVIEDCAQSLGARDGDVPAGGRGAAAVASFFATKVITTGQGGLLSSREPDLLAQAHDRVDYDQRDDWQPRFSYRMSELQAALGLWQLERLSAFLARRQALAASYDAALGEFAVRRAPGSICYRYLLRVPDAGALIETLQERGIGAKRPVYRPLHHFLGGDTRHAQAAHEQIVSLPLYPALADAEAERVVEEARRALGNRRAYRGEPVKQFLHGSGDERYLSMIGQEAIR